MDLHKSDSRLKGYGQRVTHPTLPLERTYCVRCGKPKGWVTTESADFIRIANIIVICDECEERLNKLGPIPLKRADIQEVQPQRHRDTEPKNQEPRTKN
jgi:hypothetical protein